MENTGGKSDVWFNPARRAATGANAMNGAVADDEHCPEEIRAPSFQAYSRDGSLAKGIGALPYLSGSEIGKLVYKGSMPGQSSLSRRPAKHNERSSR
jgi:hypothetical protein